jgi:hypothetical protein
MTFKLYKNPVSPAYTVTKNVDVINGVFNVNLDGGSLAELEFDREIDLGITLDGEGVEMTPRIELGASPFARALPGFYTYWSDDGDNQAYNVVGGGDKYDLLNRNRIVDGVVGAVIAGGGGRPSTGTEPNEILADWGTIGGGSGNTIVNRLGTIAGGVYGVAGLYGSVGGGSLNRATGERSMVPGGHNNQARGDYSFAAGYVARAIHEGSFVWADKSVSFNDSLLSTGENQFIIRAVGGVGIGTNSPRALLTLRGPDNPHSGPIMHVSGDSSDQSESGRIRFVEGTAANNYRGAYIHYDGEANELNIGVHNASDSLSASDSDVITIERGSGEVGIKRSNPSHPLHIGTDGTNGNGAHVTVGGDWTNGSSRKFKTDFENIDKMDVLERLASIPIQKWKYKNSDEGKHVGPIAEDFYETFGLGSDDRYIGTTDAAGVSMASIQALYKLVKEQQAEIEQMRETLRRAGLE